MRGRSSASVSETDCSRKREARRGQERSISTLAAAAEVALDCSIAQEACALGLAPTASTTTMLALGDALAVTLSERRGFKEEDFANLHPGGKLGKRLARVESLMHSGEALPCVGPATKMPDVIYEMSRKKLGVTAVVEGEKLVGIISDGDLRRLLEKRGKDVMDLTAGEAMTRVRRRLRLRVCGNGAGADGREEDYFADGGGCERKAGRDCASARFVDDGTGVEIESLGDLVIAQLNLGWRCVVNFTITQLLNYSIERFYVSLRSQYGARRIDRRCHVAEPCACAGHDSAQASCRRTSRWS